MDVIAKIYQILKPEGMYAAEEGIVNFGLHKAKRQKKLLTMTLGSLVFMQAAKLLD